MSLNQPEELSLLSTTGVERPLVLKFGGSLVEQLGAQLYPSVTATVAELISNAWDADAQNVWVSIPFAEDWSGDAELIVLDDGLGMTRREAQDAYLVVGRKKRLGPYGDRSESGRAVHGRKGIGKLAAFGTAGYLECTTLRNGVLTSFGLDYDELRRLNPDQNYFVDIVSEPESLIDPDGNVMEHGTRVRLSKLRVKRKISPSSFELSMSRRFALRGMNVFINGRTLERFSIPLQFRLPLDKSPVGVNVDSEGWGLETLPAGDKVRWWIGFTEKPLVEGDQQGISVLARDKMAQRPFKFERSQGTTSQLGLEYLVGEVEADWLDQGDDIDSDYIQSNRDQLQLENSRLDEFMNWGRERLAWALRARQELREQLNELNSEKNAELDAIFAPMAAREKKALRQVAARLARVPEIEQPELNSIMQSVVASRSEAQVRGLMDEIVNDLSGGELRELVAQFGAIDARRLTALIEARLATIDRLLEFVDPTGVSAEIEPFILRDSWLVDPRWHLLANAVEAQEAKVLRSSSESENGPNTARSIVLRPSAPAPLDEIKVIRVIPGSIALASNETNAEARERFVQQLGGIRARYENDAVVPSVHGLMIAANFGGEVRSSAKVAVGLHAEFMTWMDVLLRSKNIHEGWFRVSVARSKGDPL